MARKIISKAVQGTLFGEDEIKMIKTKPLQYDAYMQGARDMLLQIINIGAYQLHQKQLRHLPRRYMKAMIERLLKDKEACEKILNGDRFSFKEEIDPQGKKMIVCDKIKKSIHLF